MKTSPSTIRILFLMASASVAAAAVNLGTYKGCAATDADFEITPVTTVTTGRTPTKMVFDKRDNGIVDIYFIEIQGSVKKYDGETKTVSQLGQIQVMGGSEDGLVGIAMDPDFKRNRTLYFDHSYLSPDSSESSYRISRFQLTPAGQLDMASQKILMRIHSNRRTWHTAGDMLFDAYGDLWIAIGDNETLLEGPGNTADLRGGIIRIHPDNSEKGYSIPKGNFGEYFAAKYRAEGNEALAKQYEDPQKVQPEIYVKGTRNAYTITLDPVRRWLAWGDVGPDQGMISEEYNLVTKPAYMGWPYFAGEEDMGGRKFYLHDPHIPDPVPVGNLRSGPVNNAGYGGLTQLPAIQEPILKRKQACAMSGPLFRYDGGNPSAIKFPPQFNRKWIISGCDAAYGFRLLTLSPDGTAIIDTAQLFEAQLAPVRANNSNYFIIELKEGPDGALYFITHSDKTIYRIAYKGACRDPSLLPETVSGIRPVPGLRSGSEAWVRISPNTVTAIAESPHEISILDLRGREVFRAQGTGSRTYGLPALDRNSLYVMRFRSPAASFSQSLFLPVR